MINKYSNIPLYSQLKDLLLEKITSGEYPDGYKIPSEEELCEMYKISRPTVRQAVSELTNSGNLFKEKGKGTFVSKPKAVISVKNYFGFTDSILDSQIPGQRSIIEINKIDNIKYKKLSEVFNIPAEQKYEFAEIKYTVKSTEGVVALNNSYISLSMFPTIIEDIKDKKPSYDILKGKYPLLPSKSKSSLDIIYTENFDAQHLQVQQGQALLKIENIIYSKSGQVVEFIVSKYRADRCSLLFENTK